MRSLALSVCLWLACACTPDPPSGTGDPPADTAAQDIEGSGDTAEGDTADTGGSGETGDTGPDDTGDTGVTDTAPPEDTGDDEAYCEIQELVWNLCATCHDAVGGSSGLSLTGDLAEATVDVVSAIDPAIDLVEPGDHAASLLYLKVTKTQDPATQGESMPYAAHLSDDEAAMIAGWIDAGAGGGDCSGG